MNIARNTDELIDFKNNTLAKSNFSLSRISMREQNEWEVSNGIISHKTGGFFYIAGFKSNRGGFEELIIYQPQNAFNGLIIHREDDLAFILLHARVEPGNTGSVQYAPTIQSTAANYQRLHGGQSVPCMELFLNYHPKIHPVYNSYQTDLGKRYYQKAKRLIYIESDEMLETGDNMIWVPLNVSVECIFTDNFFNIDLCSMIGIFDWEGFIDGGAYINNTSPTIMGDAFIPKSHECESGRIVSLEDLKDWKLTEFGVEDIAGRGHSAGFFRVNCKGREVAEWAQPLYCCSSRGRVVLLLRKHEGIVEFLVSIEYEFGIPGGVTFLPSFIEYPGEKERPKNIEGTFLSEVILSDEGGRFFQSESKYQLILVDTDFENEENQKWIPLPKFKELLKTSNLISIQLRCISSLAVSLLNSGCLKLNPAFSECRFL